MGQRGSFASGVSLEALAALGVPLDIGRPKLADDTTFYGIPFAPATSGGWLSFPSASGDGSNAAFEEGTLVYSAPIPIYVPIHIDTILLVIDATASDGDFVPITDDLRVALVAMDKDWRPTGNPVFQTVVTVSETGQMEVTVNLDLPIGRYAIAMEEEFGNVGIVNTIVVQSSPVQFSGSYLCSAESDPGIMIQYFTAPHIYGTLTDPMPTPEAIVISADNEHTYNAPLIPVFFEWTPI